MVACSASTVSCRTPAPSSNRLTNPRSSLVGNARTATGPYITTGSPSPYPTQRSRSCPGFTRSSSVAAAAARRRRRARRGRVVGTTLEWGGEFDSKERAMNRLLLVIPVAPVVTLRPAGFIALVGQACPWPTDADELLAALLAG